MDYLAIVSGALLGALISLLPMVGKVTGKVIDSAKRAAVITDWRVKG
jgi:hypothetical protein